MAAHNHSRYSPRTALAFSLAALVSFGLSSTTGVSLAGADASDANAAADASSASSASSAAGNGGNGANGAKGAHPQPDRPGRADDQGRPSAAGHPGASAGREGNAGSRAESGGNHGGGGAADSPAEQGHGEAPRGRSEEPARRDAGGAGDHRQSSRQAGADLTQPQPGSKADFSGNGANKHGAYDSTRDGSPSGNGNGGGQARGKPCAGCVGKADNKNPPGQRPDGSDHNKGYECDANHGIGRTNPAHTGCRSATATPPPPPPPPPCVPTATNPCRADTPRPPAPVCVPSAANPCTADTPPPACVPTATDPCVLSTTTAAAPGATTTGSSPACVPSTTNPCAEVEGRPISRLAVLGTTIERPFSPLGPDGPQARVLGTTVERAGAALVEGRLARTGAAALEMAAIGLGLLLAGAALTRANRRRPAGA